MARINVRISDSFSTTLNFLQPGLKYMVQTSPTILYHFYVTPNGTDLILIKSTNGGLTWSQPALREISGITTEDFSIWYDRWSGLNSDLIHVVYVTEGLGNGLYYTNFNTSTDTFSSPVLITTLGSFIISKMSILGITRARGGNLGIVYFGKDSNSVLYSGFVTSSNTGSTWGSATSPIRSTTAEYDTIGPFHPDLSSDDPQDLLLFYISGSSQGANEKSSYQRKFYDRSSNTWFSSSFGTGSVQINTTTQGYPFISGFPDLVNSQSVITLWDSQVLFQPGAKLQCFTITSSSITEKTPAVVNSANQTRGPVGMTLDQTNNNWYVFYGGSSAGGQTIDNMQIYYKVSSDSGNTWSSELPVTTDIPTIFNTQSFGLLNITIPPIISGSSYTVAFNAADRIRSSDDFPYFINAFFPTAGGSIVVT
jgi:hypothetical protein